MRFQIGIRFPRQEWKNMANKFFTAYGGMQKFNSVLFVIPFYSFEEYLNIYLNKKYS
ncbi:Uncharacterized protein dnm_045580 [Desulfonema magnum]|uniref:Uncharacterized protein n=1 Tax=Desulfonema magnum TaxID=45655 RepID=A0A975GP67_9BACT|nr:Uncharacterized protein dnm_045580 [Desulfonema magnum]